MAGVSVSSGNLDDTPGNKLDDGSNAGSDFHDFAADSGSFNASLPILWDSVSDERTGDSVREDSLNLSAKLRKSLEDAESTAKETISIQDDLEAEKVEKEELEEKEFDFEMEIGESLSL